MFPLHSDKPETMNRFMGSERAWDCVCEGVSLCHRAGIAVAFNMCLGPREFYDGTFEACLEIAREKGAAIIQIIKPKSAGGWLECGAPVFSDVDLAEVKRKVTLYNHSRKYADYPAKSARSLNPKISRHCPFLQCSRRSCWKSWTGDARQNSMRH
jgi:hypothetical protein